MNCSGLSLIILSSRYTFAGFSVSTIFGIESHKTAFEEKIPKWVIVVGTITQGSESFFATIFAVSATVPAPSATTTDAPLTKEQALFNSIKFLEKKYQISFNINIKENLNKYRHIINVYKHGYGESYLEIEKNYSSILKFKLLKDSNDMVFLFNLNEVNFDDLYTTITNLINSF